jgi:hypothetical protein
MSQKLVFSVIRRKREFCFTRPFRIASMPKPSSRRLNPRDTAFHFLRPFARLVATPRAVVVRQWETCRFTPKPILRAPGSDILLLHPSVKRLYSLEEKKK